MQLHGPKRVYTRGSLEFWFGRLEQPWDAFFAPELLKAGREFYRTGQIREVELNEGDAIIRCRVEKKDEYSVVEWAGATLVVRSSSPDKGLANTIAVAGLHEIEELVADEISALPDETLLQAGGGHRPADPPLALPGNGHGASAPAGGNGHGAPGGNGANGGAKPAALAPAAAGQPPAPTAARDLMLRFRVVPQGLVCEPWWTTKTGKAARAHPTPAVGNGSAGADGAGEGGGNGGNGAVSNPAERMKLISLTALAKKSHFHFRPELGGYLLDQVPEIPHFLKTVLPTWERSFHVEREAEVERLAKGVQTVQIEARARQRGASNAIDLEWIFRTGEQMIDASGIKKVMDARGGPVILPDYGLVTIAPESLSSLDGWRQATATFDGRELPAYLLFSLFNDQRFQVALSAGLEAWRRDLLEASPASYAVPDALRPYQRRGVQWLAHLCDRGCHGLLADEMGLGKTVQVAALIVLRPVPGKLRHLVVCPASVVPVWQEELRRFFPGTPVFVLKNGHNFVNVRDPGIWLSSYAQLRNHRELLDATEFGYAVLDEGQFIKNPDAKVTNTCFAIRAQHRVVLTGTPLENRQLDLWSILHFLLPGLLGTRSSFESELARDRDGTMEKLRRQLAPFILRRTKAQVAQELPQKVEMDLLCPLTAVQREEYARVCREGLERLGDDIDKAMREKSFGFLSLLTRLRQICCDPDLLPWLHADTSASGKLALLAERLGEIVGSGHKVVIFSQFVMFLERVHEVLEQQFPDVPRFELTGATIDRQKPVQDFQGREGAAVMLVSLKAAGTGITLHSADYVFLLDPWWNPSVEDQAIDRVHRIGQTRTVFVYRMITQGTIEERIQALKEEKKQLFRSLIEGVSGDLDLGAHFHSLRNLIELVGDAPDDRDNGGER